MEVKLLLFAHDITVWKKFQGIHNKATRANKFNKVARYKINTNVFLNMSNVESEKEINKAITLTIVLKRIKFLGIYPRK